ncbi:MAG TPA: efflux RND transporter periplasmic adaptor subunit, partial [Pseudomonadota bacterium]|nr:efflux RND transporter periplasmic adaptor subunit [Pseudomonadota bacterium]
GTLQPMVLSPVGSQVSGIVWKIHADYNDAVKKGQVLVELDPALFQAAVRREEANVAAAQAALLRAKADARNAGLAAERARALAAKNYISLAERDSAIAQGESTRAAVSNAEAGIKLAQAALDRVRLDLKNSVILSPVDGVVIARNIELGQAVVASFQAPNLFTIAEDLRKMQVLANVDEADIGHVRVGAMAEFTVDSFRGRRFRGSVAQVRNAAQTVQNVVTYVVVLQVDNSELLLRPGMTANVRLEVARRQAALLIPAAALRFKPRLDQQKIAGTSGEANPAGEPSPAGEGRRRRGEGRPGREGKDGAGKDGAGKDGAGKDGASKDAEDPTQIATPAVLYVTSDGSRSGELQPVRVRIGISDGVMTEVREGLTEGQTIVVDTARAAQGGAGMGGMGGPMAPPRPGGGGGGGGFRRGGM